MKKKILKLRVKEKEVKASKIKSYQNIPGYLFNPPIRCEHRKISKDGGYWTDFYFCRICENPCGRYKKFWKMKKQKKKNEWLKNQGVRIDINVHTKVRR